MNYLWGAMLLIGVLYGALTGNLAEVTQQALESAKEAVALCIAMAGAMAFWMGLMRIAEDAGIIRRMERGISPLLSFLFPKLPKEHPARSQIAVNMIANFFGLGWAATPAGLKAMEALEKLEEKRRAAEYGEETGARMGAPDRRSAGRRKKRSSAPQPMPPGVASNEMCTFLILNISSLQLIPVNIIAYRSQYGSVTPAAIVGPGILATAISTGAAIVFCKAMERRRG